MKQQTTKGFFTALLTEVTNLQPLYKEHMDDFGEFFPNIFMSRVADFIKVGLEKKSASNALNTDADTSRTMEIIEYALVSGDEDLRNIIRVSFFENLVYDKYDSEIKNILGEKSLSEFLQIENFYRKETVLQKIKRWL